MGEPGMRRRSKSAVLLCAAMVAGLLGGCSGDPGKPNAKSKPSTKLAKLALPEAYDTKRGWDAELDWVSKHATTLPVAVVPSGGVGLLHKTPDGYSVQLRDAATGKTRWSARPWTPPPQTWMRITLRRSRNC